MNQKLNLKRFKRVLKRRKIAKILAKKGPAGLEKWKLERNLIKAKRRVNRKKRVKSLS